MPSIQSKIFHGFLRTFNIKKTINRATEKNGKRNHPFFSKAERKKHHIISFAVNQKEVSIIGEDHKTPVHVIYFHGGMYRIEANFGHKKWMLNLANLTDCKVSYVDYPLAPEHTYLETIKMVVKTYQYLTSIYPEDHFILMGDSSGGGLALALAQYLRDQNFEHQPEKIILYSPWIRLDMRNPDIQKMTQKDLLLDYDTLLRAARAYAGKGDLSHKYLSPYFGGCEDLGELHVFYGSDEVLAPDIIRLKAKCKEQDITAVFYCFEGMQHVFNLFTFLPESQKVVKRTIEIINRTLFTGLEI